MVKMNNVIRWMRTYSPCVFSSPTKQLLGRKTSGVSFRQVTTMAGKPESEQENKSNDEHGLVEIRDVMSHSFGEGYATRCDEEGFGGIYGRNQSLAEVENEGKIHESHPDYDKSQGSEVREKEKSRFQTSAET